MKAIIIGSGIAGLATAIRLAKKGYTTEVFEANNFVGGKLSQFTINGFRFDRGPSLFTMPQLVNDLVDLVGEQAGIEFPYSKLEESCRYFYEDGTVFKAYHDTEQLKNEVAQVFQIDAEVFTKHLQRSKIMHSHLSKLFMEQSLHKASNYLNFETLDAIVHIPQLGLFENLHEYNQKYVQNSKLVQYFDRFATYNGSNPYQAPATLHIIPHLEHSIGAFFPKGGMYSITDTLYKLAIASGVKFHFNAAVSKINVQHKKVQGITVNDVKHTADVVISNMDIYPTYTKLLADQKQPKRLLNQEKSSSALIFYWGISRSFSQLHLHNILFSQDYKTEFDGIFNSALLSSDPTVYINITSKLNETDAPKGMENWFVMVNVPNNSGQNWDELVAQFRSNIIYKINRVLHTKIEEHIIAETHWSPPGIESLTSSFKGALYGNASNNKMAAFLRHRNKSKSIKGLYFCGGSVHPGGGIPLCLLSAKIVSELLD